MAVTSTYLNPREKDAHIYIYYQANRCNMSVVLPSQVYVNPFWLCNVVSLLRFQYHATASLTITDVENRLRKQLRKANSSFKR